jgi:hypothetical protein
MVVFILDSAHSRIRLHHVGAALASHDYEGCSVVLEKSINQERPSNVVVQHQTSSLTIEALRCLVHPMEQRVKHRDQTYNRS